MTKNEYLITLAAKLQKLTDDPRGIYPELRSLIEFYQEMIEDKIEDGMTEDEAVAAMETPEEIVDRLKREFNEAAAEDVYAEPETPVQHGSNSVIRREYSAEKINTVCIRDSDHPVRIIPGECIALNYRNDDEGEYTVSLEGDVLKLTYKGERRSFFRFIFGGWKRSPEPMTLELPRKWSGTADVRTVNAAVTACDVAPEALEVHTSNGRLVLENIDCGRINASSSNGSVQIEDVKCRKVELGTSNGRVACKKVCADDITLTNSNGSVNVQELTGGKLSTKTSNGSIKLIDVSCGVISAVTGNASIKVENVAGDDITLRSSNGSISGNICGAMADYTITSKTANGSNNLPNGTNGAKKLDVRTANAKIAIEFEEKINAEE